MKTKTKAVKTRSGLRLDLAARPGDEIVDAPRTCRECGGEMQEAAFPADDPAFPGRAALVCPRHGYVLARQNRSLVGRVLGQLG